MEERPIRPLTPMQQGVIALAVVSMGVGMSTNFVVVSPLALAAGLTPRQIALVLVGSAALYAVLTPFWGQMAEKFGRKRVMAFSMFASGATNAAFIFALSSALAGIMTGLSAFFLLAFVRLFFGMLSPGINPASMAAIADATTSKNRAAGLGMIGAAMGIGSIVGPAAIAVLVEFGPLAPLWGAVLFNFFCAAVLMVALPPTRKSRDGIGQNKRKPLSFTDKRVRPYLIFVLGYFTAVGAIQQSVAWLVQSRYELNSADAIQQSSFVFIALAVTLVVVQFGYIQPRKPDPRKIIVPGIAIVAFGYVVTAIAPSILFMILGFAIVGLGAGLAVPSINALGSMSVPIEEQGAAAGLMSAAPPAGFVVGPIFGAELYQISEPLPLIFSAVLMTILGVVAYRVLLTRPSTLTT